MKNFIKQKVFIRKIYRKEKYIFFVLTCKLINNLYTNNLIFPIKNMKRKFVSKVILILKILRSNSWENNNIKIEDINNTYIHF